MTEYKIMITGHRPGQLGTHGVQNRIRLALVDMLKELYLTHGENLVVLTGMALGPDTWVAQICHLYGIRYRAYLPFKGQDARWLVHDRKIYATMLMSAEQILYTTPSGEVLQNKVKSAYLERNRMMIADCDEAIAVFSGDWATGTGYTVKRLKSAGKPINYIGVLGWDPSCEISPLATKEGFQKYMEESRCPA